MPDGRAGRVPAALPERQWQSSIPV